MHKDLLPAIADLERAVAASDARAASAILRRLNDVTIYSGNEVYERLHAVEGRLAVVLFEGVEPAEFGKLMADGKHLYRHRAWEALEAIADRVSVEALWVMKDYMKFPSPDNCPRLRAKLANADDLRLTEYLIETIDRLACAEAAEGTHLLTHLRAMSAFRYVRWLPGDKGLSDCMRLLAARNDDRARTACARYLMELPWGADRLATMALLSGMTATRAAENRPLFQEALAKHQQPMILRTWLWGAIAGEDPDEAMLGAFADLASAENDADRIIVIDYLGASLAQLQKSNTALEYRAMMEAAENVSTRRWSAILRGYYGDMLKTTLPEVQLDRVSSRFDRGLIAIARAWETVRLDHMGCFIPLTLMIALGAVTSFGLDKLVGLPKRAPGLPVALFWSWIIWAVVNVRTHFSGNEMLAGKVRAGFVYFALLLGAIVAAIAVRVG